MIKRLWLPMLPLIYITQYNSNQSNKQMSLQKQRIKSQQATSQPEKIQKKRRYDKLATQSSQQFHNQPQSKIRSYSRQSSKKGQLNTYNLSRTKEPQKMIEQNLNLKMFINNLQEQLALQRSRLQMNKRKTQKYVKQLNREFDKEMYYSGKNPHSYMFSGIKQQYENIKHLYEEKCQEIERFSQTLEITNFQEISTYVELLQDENKLLKEKLEDIYTLKNENSNIKPKNVSKGHKHSEVERLYTEFNESEQNSKVSNSNHEQYVRQRSEQTAISHYKSKCKEYQKDIAQFKKKTKFLEQLIIEKGNNEHQAQRQSKRIIKEKRQLQIELKRLNQQIAEQQKKSAKKINSIIEVQSKKFEIQSTIFKKSLLEKNEYIEKLQKQIRFLSTMLSYWKPLDEINRNEFLNLRQPSQKEQYLQSSKVKVNDNIRKSSAASDHFMLAQPLLPPNIMQSEHDRSMRSNREEDVIKRTSGARSLSQQNVISVTKERLPQTCGKKTKSTAKKCRKVELRQIKRIGQMLRYRLIGNNFSIEQLRQLFDLSQECLQEDREFRTQYISMRQIKNILMNMPLNLSQQQAVMTSRYIVQDEVSEFVYCDQGNEIKRNIAKSIIKSLIGDYTLPNIHDIKSQWDHLKTHYLHNIESALKIIAPKGVISEAKFIELLVGLGIELKEELKDWIIASMVIQSSSLSQLNYRSLIPQ